MKTPRGMPFLALLLLSSGVLYYLLDVVYQLWAADGRVSEAFTPGIVSGGLLGFGALVLLLSLWLRGKGGNGRNKSSRG